MRSIKKILFIIIVLNIAILFILNILDLFNYFNINSSYNIIILPLGISFYIFQNVTYALDLFNNKKLKVNFIIIFIYNIFSYYWPNTKN